MRILRKLPLVRPEFFTKEFRPEFFTKEDYETLFRTVGSEFKQFFEIFFQKTFIFPQVTETASDAEKKIALEKFNKQPGVFKNKHPYFSAEYSQASAYMIKKEGIIDLVKPDSLVVSLTPSNLLPHYVFLSYILKNETQDPVADIIGPLQSESHLINARVTRNLIFYLQTESLHAKNSNRLNYSKKIQEYLAQIFIILINSNISINPGNWDILDSLARVINIQALMAEWDRIKKEGPKKWQEKLIQAEVENKKPRAPRRPYPPAPASLTSLSSTPSTYPPLEDKKLRTPSRPYPPARQPYLPVSQPASPAPPLTPLSSTPSTYPPLEDKKLRAPSRPYPPARQPYLPVSQPASPAPPLTPLSSTPFTPLPLEDDKLRAPGRPYPPASQPYLPVSQPASPAPPLTPLSSTPFTPLPLEDDKLRAPSRSYPPASQPYLPAPPLTPLSSTLFNPLLDDDNLLDDDKRNVNWDTPAPADLLTPMAEGMTPLTPTLPSPITRIHGFYEPTGSDCPPSLPVSENTSSSERKCPLDTQCVLGHITHPSSALDHPTPLTSQVRFFPTIPTRKRKSAEGETDASMQNINLLFNLLKDNTIRKKFDDAHKKLFVNNTEKAWRFTLEKENLKKLYKSLSFLLNAEGENLILMLKNQDTRISFQRLIQALDQIEPRASSAQKSSSRREKFRLSKVLTALLLASPLAEESSNKYFFGEILRGMAHTTNLSQHMNKVLFGFTPTDKRKKSHT